MPATFDPEALGARIRALETELAGLRGQLALHGAPAAVLDPAPTIYTGVLVDISGPDGPDYLYEQASAETEAFFGQIVTGRTARAIGVPAPTIAGCVEGLRAAALTGRPQAREHLFGPPARPARWYASTFVPLPPDAAGRPRSAFVVVDVTDRRDAELARATSEARLRALAEATPGIMFEADRTGNLFVNRFYCDYTGLTEAALLGTGWHAVIHAGDLAALPVEDAPPDGCPYPPVCELRVRRHDGAWRWFLFHSVGLGRGADGGWHWWGLAIDIHDRKRREAKLRDSEARFRSLADSAPVAIWQTDTAGAVTWLNRPWLELTGRQLADQLGDGWMTVIHPDDLALCLATFRAAFDARTPYRMEYRLRRHDGAWRQMDESSVPQYAEDGSFIGYIGSCIDVTETRAALAAQALNEETLRLAVEATELGLWDLTLATHELHWSARCKAMFGIAPDAPVSMLDFFDCLHPDDRAATAAAFARAIDPAVRGAYDVEYRTIGRDDGIERWIAAKGRVLFDAQGRGVRAIGTTLDITARKQAEVALRDSEESLRLTAEATELGLWQFNVASATLTLSPRACAIYGIATDDPAASARVLAAMHPDDRARVRDAFYRVFDPTTGGNFAEEYRLRRPSDGEERWIAVTGQVFFDERAQPLRVMGTLRDVTARRAAEEALREATVALEARVAERTAQLAESEARFRAYFETVEDCLCTVRIDADGTFIHEGYNPYGEKRTGYDNAVLRGRPVASCLAAAHAQVMQTALAAVRAHGTHRFTGRLDFPAGEGVFDTLIVPVRDGDGRILRLLVASREVTEQVRMEEALRQTQKMQAIGQLTGGIAHDFNNLLTGVIGSLELLEREVASARGRRLLDAAHRSAARGAQLTAQLLAFGRRQRLEPRALDLNALVNGMAGMLRSTLGGTVQVASALAADLWPALGDATQIELAILNVAINARDAMPGGGTIEIITANVETAPPETAEDPPEGPHVMLAVRDDGSGMPAETLSRIFEPFFTTKDIGRGSGLGLPQVLGVAKQLGGGVRVTSRPGAGTTVAIYLPRAAAPAATAQHPPPDAPQPLPAGLRVLLIDDDADVRQVAAGLLDDLGCSVLHADSGQQALALLDAGAAVDVAMVDYAMPGMNGHQTIAAVRASRPGLKLLLATGYADFAALAEDDVNLLRKPFTAGELARALGAVVGA